MLNMKKVLIAALLLATTPALAGSITVSATTAGGTLTKTYAVSDADVARILAVMKNRYGPIATGPADPVTGIVPTRPRTNAEVFLAWIGGFMQGMVDAVQEDETAAAKAAVVSPTPISAQ